MMDGLLDKTIQYLVDNGYQPRKTSETSFTIELTVLGNVLTLECELPEFFPYVFPSIKLTEESYRLLAGTPHRFTDNSLCLFNPADAKPNFLNPTDLVLCSIRKAEGLLAASFSGENQIDFQEEILNYWNKDNKYNIHLFSELPDDVSKIYISRVNDKKGGTYLATSSSSENEALYERIKYGDPPQSIESGLYIPLQNGFAAHDVSTEKTIWAAIAKRISSQNNKKICTEVSSMNPNAHHFYIVSFPDNNGNRIYIAWRGGIMSKIDGFREGHVSPFLYWYLQKEDGKTIDRATVTLCMQTRLFSRGSYGYQFRFQSIALVGCGAVGSNLCAMLASMGTTKYILIDKEVLTIENIARHICGYSRVGYPKSFSLKWELQQNNPNISCSDYYEDAFSEVLKQASEINQCDLLFVSVGDLPVEAYILKLAQQGCITVPIVITWVEPRCYAAHMVYISHADNAFENLVDFNTMMYKNTVINQPSLFIEHEPGCQNGYIPYSGLDVQNFLSECLHVLSRICSDDTMNGNYHIIWVGELSEARRNNIAIHPNFETEKDFSLIIKRID